LWRRCSAGNKERTASGLAACGVEGIVIKVRAAYRSPGARVSMSHQIPVDQADPALVTAGCGAGA
jgi:hypothetical protein